MDIQSIIALNLNAWMENHPRLNSALAVAGATGVGRTTIQRYLKGTGNPTIENLTEIAKAFRRPLADIFRAPELPENAAPLVVEQPVASYSVLAQQLAQLADEMNDEGKWELIGMAKVLARLHPITPRPKTNRK